MMSRFSGERCTGVGGGRHCVGAEGSASYYYYVQYVYIQRWCLHTCSANAYASTRNVLDINTSEELNWRAEQQRKDDHRRAAEGERSGMEEG